MEQTVTLCEILQAREDRVRRQEELLARFAVPVICFTMNIAGPVKNAPLITRGFELGCALLEQQLLRVQANIVFSRQLREKTGCEALYAVDFPAHGLKAVTVELEEASPLGRLFDMDVLTPDGKKLERSAQRGCLICGAPGRACARSRAHSVAQLQEKTEAILTEALLEHDCRTAAALAARALLFEVCTTPKPGLVDRNNAGSHKDMDIYSFLSSTTALQPYFEACTRIGRQTAQLPPTQTFSRLRLPGRLAEGEMLKATGGVNTHKGAVFTMGTICGALGRLERSLWREPARVLAESAAMTEGLTQSDFAALTEQTAVTAGQKLYLRHGMTGVRGQMEAGLPTVLHHGLPALEQALAEGKSRDEAGAQALLALIASTEDTNLVSRGGPEALQWAASAARSGQDPAALDRAFTERNLSPGGCADLLAVCWFLHMLRAE